MRVFLTGATALSVPISFQNSQCGSSRSRTPPFGLRHGEAHPSRAEVFGGDVNDMDHLRTFAEAADGIIHAALQPRLPELQTAQRGGSQGHRGRLAWISAVRSPSYSP